MFLLIGWQFGPLVILAACRVREAHRRTSTRESSRAGWPSNSIRRTCAIRNSGAPAPRRRRCIVAEYDGDWGGPMRRGVLRHARAVQRFVDAGRHARHLARRAVRVGKGRARLRRSGDADGALDQAMADGQRAQPLHARQVAGEDGARLAAPRARPSRRRRALRLDRAAGDHPARVRPGQACRGAAGGHRQAARWSALPIRSRCWWVSGSGSSSGSRACRSFR